MSQPNTSRWNSRIYWFVVLLVSSISTVATAVGISTLFVEQTPEVLVFAGMISLAIQCVILLFWESFFRDYGVSFHRLVFLLLGLVVSLASGIMASGSYLYQLNRTGLESLLNQRAMLDVSEPMESIYQKYRSINDFMATIESDALYKAGEESAVGGTCLNDTNPRGECGPICRMRNRIASEAEDNATLLEQLSTRALDLITQASGSTNQSSMNASWKSARALLSDATNTRLRDWTRRTLRDFKKGFVDTQGGTRKEFRCDDPDMVTRLETMIEELTTLPVVSVSPPTESNLTVYETIRATQQSAFARLAHTLGWSDSLDEELQNEIDLALSIAAFIELLLVCLLYLKIQDESQGLKYLESPFLGTSRVPEVRKKALRNQLELLSRLVFREGSRWYFVRPMPAASHYSEIGTIASQLVDIFNMRQIEHGVPVELRAINASYQDALLPFSNTEYYQLYSVPRRLKRTIRTMSKNLGLPPVFNIEFDATQSPP